MQAFSASRADKDFSDPNDVLNGFSLREAPASEEEWADRYIIFMSPDELIRTNSRMRFPDYAVNEAVNRMLQHPKVEFLDGLIYGVLNCLNDANLMMRLFTVVSVIFLPLTVITGWFGMNFRNMPELEWTFGYPAVAIVSVLVTIGIIWFCKRRKYV